MTQLLTSTDSWCRAVAVCLLTRVASKVGHSPNITMPFAENIMTIRPFNQSVWEFPTWAISKSGCLTSMIFFFYFFYVLCRLPTCRGNWHKKKSQGVEKTARSIRIARDLLTFCLTNSLREYLMNYEYINALLISYIIIMVCWLGRGIVNSIVKTVAVTEKACWSPTPEAYLLCESTWPLVGVPDSPQWQHKCLQAPSLLISAN